MFRVVSSLHLCRYSAILYFTLHLIRWKYFTYTTKPATYLWFLNKLAKNYNEKWLKKQRTKKHIHVYDI